MAYFWLYGPKTNIMKLHGIPPEVIIF